MDLKKNLDRALNTPVSRRGFLLQLTTVALAVIGVSALLRRLGLSQPEDSAANANTYYGGRNRGGGR